MADPTMEHPMFTGDEDDFSSLNLKDLSPQDWDLLRRRAIERAHRTRSELMKALVGRFFTAVGRGVSEAARAGSVALARWRSRRRDRAAIARLQSLDDYVLKDIGIQRTEIESVVHAHGNDGTRARREDRLAA
jgi:uncharacterized protein YjiS (DUF1127 family)